MILVGIVGIFFPTLMHAGNISKELALIFPDRTITLNFSAQPELLQNVPSHSWNVNGISLPVDFGNVLPDRTEFIDIETQFHTEISPVELQKFFESASILRDHKDKRSVEIQVAEEGNIIFEGTPHDGFEIEQEKLVQLINNALLYEKKFVRVPAKKIFSDVVVHPTLKERGIQEIIAVGESNFAGSSEARKQNIIAGANKFNGILVPKGKVFSFNHILESVEEEDGFVRELVIKGNKTEKELGGGVCQVSTTAFRAAFSGGFPITQRRNHSYAVPYYKPYGLDAAIYLGALDFRFRNNTLGDILIQTFTEGDNLFFVFYGTDDGREVVTEGPFISDYTPAPDAIVYRTEDLPKGEIVELSSAHDGFRSEWIRRVEYGNQSDIETFVSEYQPWPARQQIGTKVSMGDQGTRDMGQDNE